MGRICDLNELISKVDDVVSTRRDAFETITAELISQIECDDDSYTNKGYELWQAYKVNPDVVDRVLMALCGWCMKSILTLAGIIDDDEGLLMN